MKKRKSYTSGFKTNVVLEVLQERETVQEIGRKYDLHPSQISTWKNQFLSNASTVLKRGYPKLRMTRRKTLFSRKLANSN